MLPYKKKTVKLQNETYAYLDVGEGEPLLLVHGNMSSGVHYLPLIELLKSQYRLIAPDLRGFGDSSYNAPYNSFDELAQDLHQFVSALGLPPCHVVCWSAGCCVTLKYASLYPEQVKSIFAIEGGSHKGYPIFQKDKNFQSIHGKAYASKQDMANDPVLVAPAQNMMVNKNAAAMTALWDAVIYTCAKPSKEDNALYIDETLKQRCLIDLDWALANINMSNVYNAYRKGDNSISKVTCPCTFTAADKDHSVPDWMVMENVNALKERAKLIIYVNCGHSPLVDCPARLAADVKAHIAASN